MTKFGTAMSEQDLEQLTSLFRTLSDKTRLTIVLLLSKGERNVSSLCEELNLPQPTVSHHLGLLRSKNVVTNRRDGKQVFYVLNGRENQKSQELVLPLEFSTARFNVKIAGQAE